jgi:sugar/nucleoside kinase (ribokinase family)
MLDVITIGSSTVDFFIETDFALTPWNSSLGKALAIPFGEKFSAKSSFIAAGGNAINTAVTFRRQGLKTASAVKVGLDISGQMIEERLRNERIKNKFVVWDNDEPTSHSVILLQKGERSIITYQGSGAHLKPSDLNFKKMRAKWWYVSLSGDSYKFFPAVAKASWEMGVKLALNPTVRHIRDGKKQLINNLKYVDFVVMNEGEAAELVGSSFSDEADIFRKVDKIVPGLVAVTRGSKGSIVSDGEHILRAGIFKEKKMADRTGAGDAYGSGFVAGLIRAQEKCGRFGCDPEKLQYALRLATANAASVVEHLGASENTLYKEDFDNSPRYRKLKVSVEKVK